MQEKQPNENKELAPIGRLKMALSADSVQQQFKNALQDSAPLFIASLIDVYGADSKLQRCAPALVIQEALKAATLKLPINKNLGFAYIIPYDKSEKQADGSWKKTPIPQFQPGYKAFIQLAMRTGQYRYINADVIYEGETVNVNRLTGAMSISGEPKSDKPVGYFAYFETLNGFSKAGFMTSEKALAHAKRYSKSWNKKEGCFIKDSGWDTSFDAMAIKTVLKGLLSKYGILSVEMLSALNQDSETDDESAVQNEIEREANQDIIDVEPTKTEPEASAATETMQAKPANGTAQQAAGPDF